MVMVVVPCRGLNDFWFDLARRNGRHRVEPLCRNRERKDRNNDEVSKAMHWCDPIQWCARRRRFGQM
jgi:hypothetical protein